MEFQATETPPAAPAWTHVALTYDGSAPTASLHVDGGAGTSVAFSGLATGGSVRITGAAVDDLRVYASDLSADVQLAGAPEPAGACPSYNLTTFTQFDTDNTLTNLQAYITITLHGSSDLDIIQPATSLYGFYKSTNSAGHFQFPLPTCHDTYVVWIYNRFHVDEIRLYIGTADGTWTQIDTVLAQSAKKISGNYIQGEWIKIDETGTIIPFDVRILTFSAGSPPALSPFMPAECASSVPAGWDLSVPGACYIKYASTNSDGTTTTCDAGHTYFYISAQCMIDLGYTDGGTDSDSLQGSYVLSVTHHAYSAVGSTSRTVKIWWRNDKDKLSDTSGDYIFQGRADPSAAVFDANDYLVLPAYSSSSWTAA